MNQLKSIFKFSLLLGLMFGALWLAFSNMDLYPEDDSLSGTFSEKMDFIVKTAKTTNPFWMIVSGAIAMLSHFFRSERWRVQLEGIGYRGISSSAAFLSVINGYFVNMVIPRGGEISRPVMLQKLEKVPTDISIGTVVAERVIDLLLLIVLIGVIFISQFTKFSQFIQDYLNHNADKNIESSPPYILYGILIFIILSGLFFFFLYKYKQDFFTGFITKVKAFLGGLKVGLLSILKLEKKWLYALYSLAIWACYFLMIYTIFKASDYTSGLGMMDALTIFVVGGIAMAIPMPGGAGSYHLLVAAAFFTLCGLPDATKNTAFTTVFHGWHTIVLIVVGGISLFISQYKIKNANKG